MNHPVEFHLSVESEQGSQEENRAILAALAREMETLNAEVTAIAPEPATKDVLEKGDGPGSLLDIKIDLDALRSLGKWIYQRLTPGVKVKFKHPTAGEFEFEGRSTEELDAVMERYERFISSLGETN